MLKIQVLALGNPKTIDLIASSVSGNNIDFVLASTLDEALKKLNEDNFDLILVDSLIEISEVACSRFYSITSIPIILLTPGVNANWPDLCSIRVDGFISEESSNIELVARIKASVRRKPKIPFHSEHRENHPVIN
jgi:DNA-binding response OmpR family regulator